MAYNFKEVEKSISIDEILEVEEKEKTEGNLFESRYQEESTNE